MLSDLTPSVSSVLLLLLYLIFGVGFPLLFMFIIRKVKALFLFKTINR